MQEICAVVFLEWLCYIRHLFGLFITVLITCQAFCLNHSGHSTVNSSTGFMTPSDANSLQLTP